MDNRDIASEWFRVAEQDIQSALFLRDMIPTPLEIICYHCQQSAEKYLKGFLALNGEPIHKTHDLTILNKLCLKYDTSFSDIGNDCLYLTDFGVNVRYPFGMEINEHDMQIAISKAIRLQKFVSEKLNNF